MKIEIMITIYAFVLFSLIQVSVPNSHEWDYLLFFGGISYLFETLKVLFSTFVLVPIVIDDL